MEQTIKTYDVKVVRNTGVSLLTGQILEHAEEEIVVDAFNPQEAHRMAQLMTTLQFRGQVMRIYIDGQEHLDEKI